MAYLKTNYVDDILDTSKNTKRKYRMINNADGTVSFEDVTDYVQNGDSFGATDVNAITERVNRSLTSSDIVDNLESTETKLPLSANMGREMFVNGLPFLKTSSVSDSEGNPYRPKDFKDSAISAGYAYGNLIGLGLASYIPIITSRWYESSDLIRTTQLAITGTGIAIRYSTSETTWSDWTIK